MFLLWNIARDLFIQFRPGNAWITDFDSQGWHNFLGVHEVVESYIRFGIYYIVDFNVICTFQKY